MGFWNEELGRRALSAYFRYPASDATTPVPQQPSEAVSGFETVGNRHYAVLRNSYRLLAVFRVRPDGTLKRLRRWPAELEK